MARIIKETFTIWFTCLEAATKADPDFFLRLTVAWNKIRVRCAKYARSLEDPIEVLPLHQDMKEVYGLMSNVIVLLYRLGWRPYHVCMV